MAQKRKPKTFEERLDASALAWTPGGRRLLREIVQKLVEADNTGYGTGYRDGHADGTAEGYVSGVQTAQEESLGLDA